ncbi:MAG: hypothetical protein HYZ54_07290 [Ignavibacteriae bacterium]|nr:hypothetical protein [Ignavibacteriota bacterium]
MKSFLMFFCVAIVFSIQVEAQIVIKKSNFDFKSGIYILPTEHHKLYFLQ